MSSSGATVVAGTRTHRGPLIIFGLILVVFAGLFALMLYGLQLRSGPPLASGPAPQFELTTFDGQHLSTQSLRGKAVVLNFWASWCIPCRDESPALESAWQKYRDQGLAVVGVDYVDTEPEAKKFISDFKQTYPNGADVGTLISQAYRITGVPETFFIKPDGTLLAGTDAQGALYGHLIGPVSDAQLAERIQLLLKP